MSSFHSRGNTKARGGAVTSTARVAKETHRRCLSFGLLSLKLFYKLPYI